MGRWLNPDPAGTVNGLNLFRMSNNSPISWHDPDGRLPTKESTSKIPIVKNFHKGDLMYGISTGRDTPYLKVVEDFHKKNPAEHGKFESNDWARRRHRNTMSMIINSYSDPFRSSLSDKLKSTFFGGETRKTAIKDAVKMAKIGRSESHGFDFETYKSIATGHSKLKVTRKHKDEWTWWKRGSKSGIEMVSQNPASSTRKLHFILDGADMEGVTTKYSERYGNSITASELRYVYRHWDSLENKVIFYKGNKVTNAPWKDEASKDGKLWEAYKRSSKFGVLSQS